MSLSKPVLQRPNPTLPRSSSSSSPEPAQSGRQERKRRKARGRPKGKAKRLKLDPTTRPSECRAFQECFAVLAEGISDLEWLAAELYSKELISARDLYAPINIMPHYPPYGQKAGNIGALTCHGNFVLEILVPRTKIFAGKYGPPLEKSVRVEVPHFRPSFSNKKYKTTANQRRASLVTLNAPGEVSNKTELLFSQAESATASF